MENSVSKSAYQRDAIVCRNVAGDVDNRQVGCEDVPSASTLSLYRLTNFSGQTEGGSLQATGALDRYWRDQILPSLLCCTYIRQSIRLLYDIPFASAIRSG